MLQAKQQQGSKIPSGCWEAFLQGEGYNWHKDIGPASNIKEVWIPGSQLKQQPEVLIATRVRVTSDNRVVSPYQNGSIQKELVVSEVCL